MFWSLIFLLLSMDDATEKGAKVEVAVTPPSDSGPVQNGIAHNVEEVNDFFILIFILVLVNLLHVWLCFSLKANILIEWTVYILFSYHLQLNPVYILPYIKEIAFCSCPSV